MPDEPNGPLDPEVFGMSPTDRWPSRWELPVGKRSLPVRMVDEVAPGVRRTHVLNKEAILLPSRVPNGNATALLHSPVGGKFQAVYAITGRLSRIDRLSPAELRDAISWPSSALRVSALVAADEEGSYELVVPAPRTVKSTTPNAAVESRLLNLLSTSTWLAEWVAHRSTQHQYLLRVDVPRHNVLEALRLIKRHESFRVFLRERPADETGDVLVTLTMVPNREDSEIRNDLWHLAVNLRQDLDKENLGATNWR